MAFLMPKQDEHLPDEIKAFVLEGDHEIERRLLVLSA
jgi:hypothetical protein